MQRLPANNFVNSEPLVPIIDVRTPSEFLDGHIPGAINIPVFSDKERAMVGTTYKQIGKVEAIDQGLGLVGPKMQSLAQEAQKMAFNGGLKLYCWRGGMRSEKMAWLFELVGIDTFVLDGGYKGYRLYINQTFAELSNLIVLQGPTGSGKTAILNALKTQGEQVIDLEGLANHKGSAFGGLGMAEQPTTQQFQSNIFEILKDFDLSRRVWVESESMSIGRVYLPETLWKKMNQANRVIIELSRQDRLNRIIKEYGAFRSADLASRIKNLTQRLGGNNVKSALEAIADNDISTAADILLKYYDKAYSYSADKYKSSKPLMVRLPIDDPEANARLLIQTLDNS